MLFQTKQAAELLSMEPWQVQSYVKQGFLEPAKPAHGAGSRREYDFIGLLKLSLLHRLCEDGFDLRTVRPIFARLFDLSLPAGEEDPAREIELIRSWFRDKVMITCRRFQLRKMVRRERLSAAVLELIPSNPGLYLINLGLIVDELLERVANLHGNRHGGADEAAVHP